jgi:hypothetical protein
LEVALITIGAAGSSGSVATHANRDGSGVWVVPVTVDVADVAVVVVVVEVVVAVVPVVVDDDEGCCVGWAVGGLVHALQLAGHWLRCPAVQSSSPAVACALQLSESTKPLHDGSVGAGTGLIVCGAAVVGAVRGVGEGVCGQNVKQCPGHC